MGNTDKKFLESLNTVLGELRRDYLKDGAEVGQPRRDSRDNNRDDFQDSIDDLKQSQLSEADRTRSSG